MPKTGKELANNITREAKEYINYCNDLPPVLKDTGYVPFVVYRLYLDYDDGDTLTVATFISKEHLDWYIEQETMKARRQKKAIPPFNLESLYVLYPKESFDELRKRNNS